MLSAGSGGVHQAAPVPLARLDFAEPELLEELLAAVRAIAERGAFTLGAAVEEFEQEFAAYCETDFAVGVSSGTEALALALRALEIGPGDEVVVPTNSFIATAEAVSAVGATPVLVDVDEGSHLLTAELLEPALGPRVRCVIPVHLFGATVAMGPIMELAHEAGVHVIEDTCQAHGARWQDRRVGSFGAFGCFSFYPTKNLGAWGDGGAVVTSVPELAERVRLLRAHGEQPRYTHRVIGTTARLDALQAAVLRLKLERLEGWNEQRRALGEELRTRILEGLAEHDCEGLLELADPAPRDGDHVYHLFVARTDERERLREHLTSRGIASAVHYPTPIHLTEAYAHLGMRPGSLPVSERHAERMCSLPLYPAMTADEVERVADAVVEFAQASNGEGR
jgi:dTDP-3-amino-3,4,6-trideoxy-alpha-D-glucose transaminase